MPEKSEKKHFNLITCLLGTIYIFLFLIITTPLVLFLGPYQNTRKAFVSTLLATRHEYLLTDFFSKETLNKMMGIEAEPKKEKEVAQKIENIEIKCKNVLTNNNKSVIITPSKETRKRIKQSKKFIQFIAYINVPMKRMKIKERFG